MRTYQHLSAACCVVLLLPAGALAQLSCGIATKCKIEVAPDSAAVVEVLATGVADGSLVEFRIHSKAISGEDFLVDTAAVRSGKVTFTWQSSEAQLPAYVVARLVPTPASRTAGVGVVEFQVTKQTPSADPQRRLRDTQSGVEWLEGLQRPAFVDLETIDAATCEGIRVAFKPLSGGNVALDTVVASLVTGGREGSGANRVVCRATTQWTFANTVGRQYLRAHVIQGSDTVLIQGLARAKPRFTVGTSFHFWRGDAVVRSLRTDTATVQSNEYDDAGRVTSVTTTRVPRTVEDTLKGEPRGFGVDPVLGVDFAIFPEFHATRWVRLFVGVSAKEPTKRFYFAFSPTQLIWKEHNEAIPIDLHLGLQAERLEEGFIKGVVPETGKPELSSRNAWFWGVSILTVVDGGSLLSKLLSAFGA